MKTPFILSFATFSSWRFNFFSKMRAGRPRSLFLCALGVLAVSTSLQASTTWNGPTWNASTAIPDNNDVGFSDTRTVSIPDATEITGVTVNLTFTGGWNGDLYAYLVHGSGFSVLLNRPGRSLASPDGAASSGMSITIADSSSMDIHTAIPMSGGSVSGTYQPDGRETDPLAVLDTDARTAMLSNFIGIDPNGSWTLFVADQSAGETSTLQSWSMSITAVPEPSAAILGAFGVLMLIRRRR